MSRLSRLTVRILFTLLLFFPEANVGLTKPLRVIRERREVQLPALRELNCPCGRELAVIRRETVEVGGDRTRVGWATVTLAVRARIHKGRQSEFLTFGEAVGVAGRVARIEGRRVGRVLGVQVEFTEERLLIRLVVGALPALGHGQAGEQQQEQESR